MIRPASHTDIPRLVDLGHRFMAESGYDRFLPRSRQAQADLARMLIEAPNGLVLVYENDVDVITGMIGIMATNHPHAGIPVMSELFWYVEPGARGVGVRLLKAAEDWARSNGVKKSLVVAPDGRVADFYRRMGYARIEEQFIKDL